MEQVKFDREKVIAKLKGNQNGNERAVTLMAKRLESVHPDLIPLVAAWCADEFLDYTFQTMSVSKLMEIQKMNYINAIIWMDHIVKDPESIDLFHRPFFTRR